MKYEKAEAQVVVFNHDMFMIASQGTIDLIESALPAGVSFDPVSGQISGCTVINGVEAKKGNTLTIAGVTFTWSAHDASGKRWDCNGY